MRVPRRIAHIGNCHRSGDHDTVVGARAAHALRFLALAQLALEVAQGRSCPARRRACAASALIAPRCSFCVAVIGSRIDEGDVTRHLVIGEPLGAGARDASRPASRGAIASAAWRGS